MSKQIITIDYKNSFKVSLRYSFIITLIFVAIFAIALLFHLVKFTELRFINYIFVFIVCYEAIKKVYTENNYYIEYFNGLMIGILTATFGQLWYSILFYIYLNIDSNFLNYLLTEMPRDIVAPKFSITVLLLLEGFGLSPIISLGLMQYFKSKQGRWARTHHSAS